MNPKATTHPTTYTDKVIDFAFGNRFENIPANVVEYAKLVIFDQLLCGIAAENTELCKMYQKIAASYGGVEEATVFGSAKKVPATAAAMVNSQIMNILDADDCFLFAGHFAVLALSPVLAEAQRLKSSGKDLIAGFVNAFEITARMSLARSLIVVDEDGKTHFTRKPQGMGYAVIGAAAGVAAVKGLDREQTANAIRIATWLCPTAYKVPIETEDAWPTSFKYSPNLAITQAGHQAAVFAEVGLSGDPAALDREDGFFMAQGSGTINREAFSGFGKQWWTLMSALKFIPACAFIHPGQLLLSNIMKEEGLSAGEIDKIIVPMHPIAIDIAMYNKPLKAIEITHDLPNYVTFSIGYVLAVTAMGYKPGPIWFENKTLTNPDVWKLAHKIETVVDKRGLEHIQERAKLKDGSSIQETNKTFGSIEVHACGKVFKREMEYMPGNPDNPELPPTWERIEEKFHNFCGHLLSREEMDTFVDIMKNIDKLDDVTKIPFLGKVK